MITVEKTEITGLYLQLKGTEENLDENQASVLRKLENFLYDNLSVQDIENIEKLYAEKNPAVMFMEI